MPPEGPNGDKGNTTVHGPLPGNLHAGGTYNSEPDREPQNQMSRHSQQLRLSWLQQWIKLPPLQEGSLQGNNYISKGIHYSTVGQNRRQRGATTRLIARLTKPKPPWGLSRRNKRDTPSDEPPQSPDTSTVGRSQQDHQRDSIIRFGTEPPQQKVEYRAPQGFPSRGDYRSEQDDPNFLIRE